MSTRTILRALATYSMLGVGFLVCYADFVAGEEPHESNIVAPTADSQIAVLLTKIETGLKGNQMAASAGLLEMLVSAKTLLPNASPEGVRLMHDFPARLMKAADHEQDLAKSINLKVFADSAAPYVSDQKPVDGYKAVADQQVAKIEPAKILPPPPPPPAPPPAPVTATPVAPPTPMAPSPMELALVQRGDTMLSIGDIVSARLLYQHAADAGIGIAAFKLANTYESDFLAQHNVRGVKPDWQQAAIWYRKAEALGEPRAAQRLQALLSTRRAP